MLAQKRRDVFMYTAQMTKNRIKSLCKERKIIMENMLRDCSLGINAIRQINNTKGMASFSLAKIADYLDCSVDYLLGRIDNPNSETGLNNLNHTITNNGIIRGSNSINNSANIVVNNNDIPKNKLSKQAIELAEIFDSLGIREQSEILSTVFKLEKENQKK